MKWRSARGYYASTAAAGFSFSTGGTRVLDSGGVVGSSFPSSALGLFQDRTDVLASAFSYFQDEGFNITVGERSEVVTGHMVSGDYFRGIGVSRAAAGRLLLPDDDRDRAAVAVLSHRFSVRHFGAADRAVGSPVRINNQPFTVVIPGVEAVGVSTAPLPTGGDGSVPTRIRDAALSPDPAGGDRSPVEALMTVGPSYFETMQIPMLEGREFGRQDVAGSPAVAIINESLADALGFQSVEGRRIALGEGDSASEYEVIGVVGNALMFSRSSTEPTLRAAPPMP